jgi:hypothetical protein
VPNPVPARRDFTALRKRLSVLALAVIVLCSLPPRILALRRVLWTDEGFHNVDLIIARGWEGLVEVFRSSIGNNQPFVEYFIRKFFWFPLAGVSELGLRLPAFTYSVLSVIVTAAWSFRLSRQRDFTMACAIALLLPALLVASNGTEIYYAGEARHYALLSLLSITFTFVFVFHPGRRWFLAVAGALFAGTHFFALPLLAFALLYGVVEEWRRTGRVSVAKNLALAALSFSLALISIKMLSLKPTAFPGENPLARVLRDPLAYVKSYVPLLGNYLEYWELPLGLSLSVLGIFAGQAIFTRNDELRGRIVRFFVLLAAVVSFLFAVGFVSDHGFVNRYFTPFFGLAPAFVLLAAFALPELAGHGKAWAGIFAAGATLLSVRLYQKPGTFWFPPPNSSNVYEFFQRQKKVPGAHLFVLFPCEANVQRYYWNIVGDPMPWFPIHFLMGSKNGPVSGDACVYHDQAETLTGKNGLSAYIDDFFRRFPGATTVFYCERLKWNPSYNGIPIYQVTGGFWAEKGLRTAEDVRNSAHEHGL